MPDQATPGSVRRTAILGTGKGLPEKVLTNLDLAAMVDTSDEWITTRTGMQNRRIAQSETASSLAAVASRMALERAGLTPEDLDLIIVATVSGDQPLPATACLLQHQLGATKAGAFDLQAGCSGFVYSLSVADRFIASGMYKHILVVGVECLSRIIDWTDRATCVLFGDGAGAAVLGPATDGRGVLASMMAADGSGAPALHVPAGGSALPASAETVANRQHYVKMAGQEIFKVAVRRLAESLGELLSLAGVTMDDVDLFIPHQANRRIIEATARKLDLDMERVYVNIERYANTSSASVILALDDAIAEGRAKPGNLVAMVAFGAGLTWGGNLIRL
ncbi:MAG: beta-ketoacyl-ACP synthase III [Planctomycetota bacterium]